MAKHNLFLGTATGSVGDVVTMRREGIQVNRVRVREVANPKTTAQAVQRNFLAPVARFYAPLATVLEKSYEGLSKSKSYSAYLKKNIELAKKSGWFLPKGQPFFPLPYQVSRGTLAPANAIIDEASSTHSIYVDGWGRDGGNSTNYTIAQLTAILMDRGYKDGDQITIIGILPNDDEYYPVYERFYLSSEDDRPITDVLSVFAVSFVSEDGLSFITAAGDSVVAGCVIVSRWENGAWRRSTERVALNKELTAFLSNADNADASIRSYQQSATTVASDVYLNGSTSSVVATDTAGERITLVGLGEVTITPSGSSTPVTYKAALGDDGVKYVIQNFVRADANYGKAMNSENQMVTVPAGSAHAVNVTSATGSLAQFLLSAGLPASFFA